MASSSELKQGRGLLELLGRAVIDPEFRIDLFDKPESMAKQYGLSSQESAVLKMIGRSNLEKAAGQIAERSEFAVGPGRWQELEAAP